MKPNEYPLLIGGEWKTTGDPVEIRSPYDGRPVGLAYRAGPAEIEAAIAAAEKAFASTRHWPVWRRVEILEKIIAGIKARKEELARLISLEAGKPIKNARTEVSRAIITFTDALEECKRIRGEWLPLDIDPSAVGRQGLVRRFPLGPITGITPFNFPLNLVAHKVAPAMACGNTMLLKPASQTPLTALTLARIVEEAGAAPGMLNVLFCHSSIAEPLVTDERIKYLTFTGSGVVGWALKQKAGKKRVGLELGGNAGVIVHSDADLDYAAQRCVVGKFAYAGQTCISVQRIFVHRPVFDAFTEKFLSLTAKLKVGDPLDEKTDLGPLITEADAIRAEAWVKEAVAAGACLLSGGERSGSLMQPTVLTGTRPDMNVNCLEVFAPVATLEPYDDFRVAIDEVNRSAYGLQAGVFTQNVDSIFHALEELEVGGVIANDVPTWRADPMPYGGMKDSGIGREGVRYAIEEMTERKILVLNLDQARRRI